jgi:hypothetical protein
VSLLERFHQAIRRYVPVLIHHEQAAEALFLCVFIDAGMAEVPEHLLQLHMGKGAQLCIAQVEGPTKVVQLLDRYAQLVS